MKDYSKGKIYIVRNTINDMVYIGSTIQKLSERMRKHRSDWRAGKRFVTVHKGFTEHGVDNFYIELYENFPCNNVEELRRREGEVQRLFKDKAYNRCIAGRTKKEWCEDNKDDIAAKHQKYYEKNHDKLLAKANKYYDANRDKVLANVKKYREINHEKKAEYNKIYNQKNKENIAARQRENYIKRRENKLIKNK